MQCTPLCAWLEVAINHHGEGNLIDHVHCSSPLHILLKLPTILEGAQCSLGPFGFNNPIPSVPAPPYVLPLEHCPLMSPLQLYNSQRCHTKNSDKKQKKILHYYILHLTTLLFWNLFQHTIILPPPQQQATHPSVQWWPSKIPAG